MNIIGIIPARYASTRFPAKPLAMIGDKSMIQRVYEQAQKAQQLQKVVVATDDVSIAKHVEGFGGHAVITSTLHQSGTDRCHEALQLLKEPFDYVINIQGDEPFIDPKTIDLLASMLNGKTEIATLGTDIQDEKELFNPNVVKVVRGIDWQAMYFSRQAIPYVRNAAPHEWLQHHDYCKHIGIYAYRTDILAEITQLHQSTLETLEALEQLRWLQNGYKILVGICNHNSFGIDTPEDLQKAIELIRKKNE